MAIQAQFYSGFSQGENGYNICFTPQQQQPQQQFMQFHNHPFSAHIEKQRRELEHFINFQSEQLGIALEQQRKQQEAILIKKYESKTRFLLSQKDEEIAKISSKMKELQNFLKKMEMDRQVWEKAAKENESTVASLKGLIQRMKESVSLSEDAAEDAESCCPNIEKEKEKEEEERKLICKCCNFRNSCVVMLPCRHLSCCQDCEVFLDSCPVCRMAKKASIEALI